MLATESELVAIDFESTGTVEGFPNEPWQIGMVRIRKGHIDSASMYSSLLRVGDRPFSPHAPGAHHKLREELTRAPTLQASWPEMRSWWEGQPLVAHNIGTEKGFITKTAPMHKFGPWIDTLKLVRVAYPDLKSHSLEDTLTQLNLIEAVAAYCPDRAAHDALYDAVGSAVLLLHLLTLEGWETATISGLSNAYPEDFYRAIASRKRSQRRT